MTLEDAPPPGLDDRTCLGCGGTGHDVTAGASALAPFEEHLRRAQKMELVSSLAAGVSHHFNNLLMGILGASRLAARQLDEGHPALPYLAEIAAAADRGSELTRKLIALGRPREGHQRPLRAGELLEHVRDTLRDLNPENIRLELVLDTPAALVHADPDQLQQVLINLSLNARDAMPDGGTLTLGAGTLSLARGHAQLAPHMEPGEYVVLSVRDTGRGMDPATLTHAFEPFYTTKASGTGLGLYIVYGIVQSLGGRIDVESRVGHGTQFRILVPAWHAPKPEPAANDRRPRILVVEDERLIRVTLRHTLGANGFDVLLAADAAEARSQFETSGGIDLLLSDMILPGATGADLAREFTAKDPNLHVLFMSAYPRDLLMAQGRITAEQPTLEKPFSEESLLAAVGQAIGSLTQRQ